MSIRTYLVVVTVLWSLLLAVVLFPTKEKDSMEIAECVVEYSYTNPVPNDRVFELARAIKECK